MSIVDREAANLFHTYKRIPLEIERGEGVYLYAKGGTRYLDLFGGLAVNSLGYGNPRVLRAIEEQSRKYIHLSNYFLQEPQIALAEMLIAHSGYKRLFFTNSGTESIEGTIKLARKWGAANGKQDLVAFSNSFHGRTMGALSLMDKEKYREGYGPFLPHCSTIEFNDVASLRRSVTARTAAVLLEFIQGEGGIYPVSTEFANELDSLRKQFGFSSSQMILGGPATGKFFGFQHFNIQPDIVRTPNRSEEAPLGAFLQ
jgi:acetylornithine/succinyldiaminopimelate/putrescine aminotransferase